jgi:hypothetical protein
MKLEGWEGRKRGVQRKLEQNFDACTGSSRYKKQKKGPNLFRFDPWSSGGRNFALLTTGLHEIFELEI